MVPKVTREFEQGQASVYTASGFYDHGLSTATTIPGIPRIGAAHPRWTKQVEELTVYQLGPGVFRVFVL